jgi:hypothetical protein
MSEIIVVNQTVNTIEVTENSPTLNVTSPGPQGPRGKTILNGTGAPSNNLGLEGDFYYDKDTTRFYGPKLLDLTWSGASSYLLSSGITSFEASWELVQVTGPVNGIYSVQIQHNLGFKPNVTVKTSGGDVLETGIEYNSDYIITLTMAQPFSGTAYLS